MSSLHDRRPPSSSAPSRASMGQRFYNDAEESNDSDSSDDFSLFSDDTTTATSIASSQLTSVTSRMQSTLRGSGRGHGNGSASPARSGVTLASAKNLSGRSSRSAPLPHSSRNSGNALEPFCSEFGHQFNEGNVPILIDQGVVGASKRHIGWQVDILSLDFSHYLPLFISGLVETDPPYNFLAYEGCLDMLIVGGPRHRVLPAVSKIIPALKLCLQSGHRPSVSKALYVFLLVLKCDCPTTGGLGAMGRAVAPYLPRMLPTLNLYFADERRIGADGAFQMAEDSLSTLVTQVLETCEMSSGPNAYKVIKYSIPTYETCSM